MSIKRQNNIDEIFDIENLIDKHNENKDLLVANEKEIAYDEEEDTIKELLAKVGLTR